MRFLDFALGSLADARDRLKDGIQLDYFPASTCEGAFRLAKRCKAGSRALKESQRRYIARRRELENEARRRRRSRGRSKKRDDEDHRDS